MEVPRHPGSIVDHQVDVVRSIGDAADAAKEEQDARQHLRGDRSISPGQRRDPTQQPLAAALFPGVFQRGDHREGRHHGWETNRIGQDRVDEFPGRRDARVGELVVEPQRHRQHQEQPECNAGQRIAEQLAARLLGQHAVPGNINRQQPEIHQRVSGEPEIGACQLRVNAINQAQ